MTRTTAYISRVIISVLCLSCATSLNGAAENKRPAFSPDGIPALEAALEVSPRNMDLLRKICSEYTHALEFHSVVRYAHRMADEALRVGDTVLYSVSQAYIGQAYMALNEQDSALYYLGSSIRYAASGSDEMTIWALTVSYNALGVYYLTVEMNYREALVYFHKALEMCETHGTEKSYSVIAGNLVRAYYYRNDLAGLPFAHRVYRYGVENGDSRALFDGAYVCALMYYLQKDYAKAEEYLTESLKNVREGYRPVEVYILYANVLAALGRFQESENYYRISLEDLTDVDYATSANIYLSYGRYLVGKGQYYEALDYLQKGLRLSVDRNISIYRYLLYKSISDAYYGLNDTRRALEYFRHFHAESDSIFNIERENSINELVIKYETEKVQRELQQSQNVMLKKEQRLQALLFALAMASVVLAAVYILYRRKNRLYDSIVRQNQEYVRKQQWIEQRMEEMKDGDSDPNQIPGKYSVSSLTEEKGMILFAKLETLMREEHFYRENFLTKERVAEMLGTNRTYLSQVINENTGLSFNHYVNSFRVEEARRILSDPSADVVLKALASNLGFSSMTTFYKVFQSEVGMPPSKFREKVIRLSK